MKAKPILTVIAVAVAVAILAGVQAPAVAASGQLTYEAYKAEFVRAVSTCETQTARGTLADLRACVHDLATPDPTNAQILDLWRIFSNCLSIMLDAGPDAMWPTSHYEDEVNECLGL